MYAPLFANFLKYMMLKPGKYNTNNLQIVFKRAENDTTRSISEQSIRVAWTTFCQGAKCSLERAKF